MVKHCGKEKQKGVFWRSDGTVLLCFGQMWEYSAETYQSAEYVARVHDTANVWQEDGWLVWISHDMTHAYCVKHGRMKL